jgi:hypothetical protein
MSQSLYVYIGLPRALETALQFNLAICWSSLLVYATFFSAPLAQVSTSWISSTSSLTNEVLAQKAAATKQDNANSKDILLTLSFSLNPRGKA